MNNSFIRKQPNCEFILRRCHGWSGAKVQKKRSLDWPLVLKDHLLNNFPTDFPLANLVPFLIFPLKPPFFPWRFLSQLGFSHRIAGQCRCHNTCRSNMHGVPMDGRRGEMDLVAKDGGFLSHGVTPKKHLFS